MRSSNKERTKVADYFLFSMAATCVLESQVGFIYNPSWGANILYSLFLYNGFS
uniref:hypothetical protein n=1 Tax=Bacillus cytotoxicus TaxID=580165 RepID=UPI0020422101